MSTRLSLITPVFDARELASKNCLVLYEYLMKIGGEFEIIVVDDGSCAGERLRPEDLPARTQLISIPSNRGKGYAVKEGMLAASGACRIFIDIDLPYDLGFIPAALALIESGYFHFVAGDRTHKDSRCELRISWQRKLATLVLSEIVQLTVAGGILDTQCGFKVFSETLADRLFPLLRIDRFAFDVEIFYLLSKYNITIKRLPVCLCRQGRSSVHPLGDGWRSAWDIMRLPINWHLGRYRTGALSKFESPNQS
jgi:dolichyl-phosphate beta-glucosyltransferase